jgi:hypothetical protein
MQELRANSSNTKPLAHTSIAKGALGVKIADVRDGSGATRVVVRAVERGGLVWRQGDVRAGAHFLYWYKNTCLLVQKYKY